MSCGSIRILAVTEIFASFGSFCILAAIWTVMSCGSVHILPAPSSRNVKGNLSHQREISKSTHSLHVPFLPRGMCVTAIPLDRLVVRRACNLFAWFFSSCVAGGAGVPVWFDQLHWLFLFLFFHDIHVL